jgi:hypothetical protein
MLQHTLGKFGVHISMAPIVHPRVVIEPIMNYDQFINFIKKSIGVIVIFFKIIIQVFGSLV